MNKSKSILVAVISTAFLSFFCTTSVLAESEASVRTFKTTNGCLTYLIIWKKTVFDDSQAISTEWDGACESGKPISGYGTLKITLDNPPGYWFSNTGKFKNGYTNGPFIDNNGMDNRARKVIFDMGCAKSENYTQKCRLAAASVHNSPDPDANVFGTCKKLHKDGQSTAC